MQELTMHDLESQLAEQLPPRELMSTYSGRKKFGGGDTKQTAVAVGGDGGNGGNGGIGVNVGVNALNGNQIVPIAVGGNNTTDGGTLNQSAGNGGAGGNGGNAAAGNFSW
jgi:hypothetical protein